MKAAAASSGRMLLVEDDARTRNVMTRLLTMEGWQVDAYTTAEAALEAMATRVYDVLITDHVLPGISGLDLAKQARAIADQIRCIVVSGYEKPDDTPPGVPWLAKPLNLDELFDTLG